MAFGQRQVYLAMLVSMCLAASVLWVPAQLGVLAAAYRFDAPLLGLLASVEVGGFLLGSVVASFVALGRLRRWVVSGGLIVILANALLLSFTATPPFLILRPIASFGSGIAFAYALKVCAQSANPTRSFGVMTGLMSVVMIIGFQVVGRWLDASSVFVAYGVLAVVALLVHYLNRLTPAVDDGSQAVSTGATPPKTYVGLAAIALSFVGQGCIFAFLQTMGAAHGFAAAGVANAMSAWALFGVIGSFSTGALPARLKRSIAIGAATCVMLGAYMALYAPVSLLWYTVGCAVGGFYWNFVLPLILGLLANIDASGRGSAWGGSMSSAGAMLGPSIAGLLIVGSDYTAVAWVSAGLVIAGFACVLWLEHPRDA